MGKVRLDCPKCGKAIAVPDTAKKARCPGCKEIIDVAEAAASSQKQALPQEEASTQAPAEEKQAPAEEEKEESPQPEPEQEAPAVAVAGEAERPSRRASRRISRAMASAMTAAGYRGWQVTVPAALVVLIVLLFLIWWPAAIAVASGLWLFADATLSKVTRVIPSVPGSQHVPILWGLIGFVPVVGLAIYVILKRKLVAASASDIASGPVTSEEGEAVEETGKVPAPSILSPGIVLLAAISAMLIVFFWTPPRYKVEVAADISKDFRLIGQNPKATYNPGQIAVRLKAREPLVEFDKVLIEVFKLDGGKAASLGSEELAIDTDAKLKLIGRKIQVPEPGRYRVAMKRPDGKLLDSTEFSIREKR